MTGGAVLRKLRLYAGEARFALTQTASWGDCARLLGATAAFHAGNWRKAAGAASEPVVVGLKIGGRRVPVTLRPQAGDLAVLYEVLAETCYALPDALTPAKDVRVVLDCGANVGIASLYFAARYAEARIFAIEPHPDNMRLLRANTAHEPRIVPIEAALVGTERASVNLGPATRAWGHSINQSGRGIEVSALTVEQIMRQQGLARIDVFKIDIEGGERDVFAHAAFLDKVGVVVAEIHGSYTLDRLNEDLRPWGMTAALSEMAGDEYLVVARRA